MCAYHNVIIALASILTSVLAQNTSTPLINPLTRYDGFNYSLALPSWPVLQRDFPSPPDCGETSYVGTGRLRGRHALVTGGDSGIGRAIVIAYLREGASVAINYMPEEEPDAQDLVDFVAQEGFEITRIPGDLMNETFCDELPGRAVEALGGLDLVVNNAGYGGAQAGPNSPPIANHSTTQLEMVFKTNFYAPFFITRAAVPFLPPGSSLLYTASAVARLPIPNAVDYAASKAALVSLVRSLSQQLRPLGIRTAGVAPGYTYSPFMPGTGHTTEIMLETLARLPQGRMEQPGEIAPLFVDLATGDKSFVSGGIWMVAGAGGNAF